MNCAFLLSFLCLWHLSFGQKVGVCFQSADNERLPRFMRQSKSYASEALWQIDKQNTFIKLNQLGYYTAFLQDSVHQNTIHVKVKLGQKFRGITVQFDQTLIPWVRKYAKTTADSTVFLFFPHPEAYAMALKSVIGEFQHNGYPFAKYSFEEVSVEENTIKLTAHLQKGPFMQWNAVSLRGDSSVELKTVQRLIGIKPGAPFSMEKLDEIDTKLQQQSFLTPIKPSEIAFDKEGANLYLYLKSNKSSSFSGALGLQPNPTSQKVGLTGDIQLKLNNALRRAEQLDLNWRSIQPTTQWLNFRFTYPYILRSLIGTDFRFQLYKRDSTFLEIKSNVGLQYSFSDHWTVRALYAFTGSNRLYAAANNPTFPAVADIKNTQYGLALQFRKLDYLPNPRKGLNFYLEGLVGQRKAVSDSSFTSLTAKISLSLEQFIPLHKRWVLRYATFWDSYYAPAIFSNECYRFGGLNSQRGFNEENFLATTKNVNQLELRYLLDKNSAVFAFYDQTFYENTSANGYSKDHPFGFGVGTNIGTKAGIFSLVYGLGAEKNNPIDLRSGKIHFGYIAYF